MRLQRLKISQAVNKLLIGDQDTSRMSKSIAAYLISTNRTGDLSSIMRDVVIDRAEVGIVEVNVRSAFKLTEPVLENIRGEIKQIYPNTTKFVVNQIIDKSVIAGIKIELPTQLIDLSVDSKLKTFKRLVTSERGV